MKTYFVLVKLYQIFLALHSHYPVDTAYRVGFDLDNSLTRWKRIIFKILKNSQFANFAKFCTKTQFFSEASSTIFFCFTLAILHTEFSFNLDISLTRWKRNIFKILKYSQFAKFAKIRMKTHFFLGKLYPKYSLLYTVITLVILNAEFGLIWTNPWPDEKELFLKFSKFAKFRMKTHFFPRQAIPTNFFLCSLITLVILHAEFG